jgi:electron transfer flavoprotein beta subunit
VLKIIVCMKIVIDPEMPFSGFKIDSENRKPIPPSGVPPVFSPFDENALESALKIKDRQECEVTILSLGKTLPTAILHKTLAAGADEVIVVEDPQFENLDPFSTSRALASAIGKTGEFSLIFTGRQAADWDAGIVWAGISEILDIPSITIARKAEVGDGKVVVERCVSDGIEIHEAKLPALVTFSSEVGELRSVGLSALLKAKRQEITKWSASDIGFEKMNLMGLKDLFVPALEVANHCLVSGENPQEMGRNLARKLVEEGILKL